VIVTIGSNMGTGPGGRYLGRSYTHINEISFQPTQTTEVMITRTKRLAVTSSRPGYVRFRAPYERTPAADAMDGAPYRGTRDER
jgi:hypothetical protein